MSRVLPKSEIFLSTRETAGAVGRELAAGRLRKIGPRLYTTNLAGRPEDIVRRNCWRIVGLYCPGALIADRTAIRTEPSGDGSVFVIADRSTDIELPGLKIRPRPGHPPLENDRPFMEGLHLSSRGRAVLENLRPSRARSGVARTMTRAEIETFLERIVRENGPAGINLLRDEARGVAGALGMQTEMEILDRMIGALLGTRDGVAMISPVAIARLAGLPYDPRRLDLFEALRVELDSHAPTIRKALPLDDDGQEVLAFFEAYFSNFIEGTEFEIGQAADIVFRDLVPPERPADAHDVRGTFLIVSDRQEMTRIPTSFEDFLTLMKRRHAVVMSARPEKAPGAFKMEPNRFGGYPFVAPDLVDGTLARGFEIHRGLAGAFERAVFMMYLVAEVHPFVDGNGRMARIMMNAELSAAEEQRLVIPSVYRDNYLKALRAMSNDGHAVPLLRTLDFAQRYTIAVPWDSFRQAEYVLRRTNALMRPDEAESAGIRLRLPTPDILLDAEEPERAPEPSGPRLP